jgi:hypothetical protein
VQNVHSHYITLFVSGFSPVVRNRVIHEFVTPKCLATSAPEYHNSCTAIHETILRALTSSRRRLPEMSSDNVTFFFLQTLSHNSSRSIFCPEILRFFFIISPSTLLSKAYLSFLVLSANTSDQPPKLRINPPPTNSGRRPALIPSFTY